MTSILNVRSVSSIMFLWELLLHFAVLTPIAISVRIGDYV